MKLFNSKKLLILILLLFIATTFFVQAQSTCTGTNCINNPIQSNTFGDAIIHFSSLVRQIATPIMIAFLVWAGFLFVTARGNEQQLTLAKKLFFWTFVGTAIFVGATALAEVVVNFALGL
jgi:hypothetical protein